MRAARNVAIGLLVAALLAPIGSVVGDDGRARAASLIERVDGDQVGVAIELARRSHADASAPVVYLANADNPAEGLSAGAAAAARGGLLLWTRRDALDPRVVDEIGRLRPSEIVVLAGTRGVSADVVAAVRALGFPVTRIAKRDRFSASRATVQTAFATASTVFLASGWRTEDAALASAAAAREGAPMLAVNGTHYRIDDLTIRLLQSLGAKRIVIVGTTEAVTRRVVEGLRASWPSITRYGAPDLTDRSVQVSRARFATAARAVQVTEAALLGALSSTARGAAEPGPVHVVGPECVSPAVVAELQRLSDPPVLLPGDVATLPLALEQGVACFDPAADAIALESALRAAVAAQPGSISVSVHVLGEHPRSAAVGGEILREPASVIKIFAAYAVLARVDRGQFALDAPTRSGVSIGDCLRVMIHISDNLCHADLLALLGNDVINRDLARAGFDSTFYVGVDGSGVQRTAKKSSTDDVAELLRRLYAGELLSPASTALLVGLLDEQLWKSKIPSGVGLGVLADNKTGSLWTTEGMMQGDAGVVEAPTAPYVIAVLGEQNATVESVRAVSQVVHDHLEGAAGQYMAYPDRNLITREPTPYYSGRGTGRLGTIPAGARIAAETSSRTWYRVQYDGQFVYVDQRFVRTRY